MAGSLIPDRPPQSAGGGRRFAGEALITTLDRWLQRVIEIPLAALLVVEIVVLSAGVVARYAFRSPFIWSDELANMLFLWLSMLGAASAFRRSEHMRMTAFVRAGSPWGGFLDMFATVAAIVFLGATFYPAYEFATDEAVVTMPALSISNAWRAAALPAGIGLMILVGCLRLFRGGLAAAMGPSLIALVVAISFALLSPLFNDLGNLNLVVFFVVLFASLVFAGVPIAFSFGLSTVAYLTFTTSVPNAVVVGRMNEGMAHPILLSVPLFIFLGLLIRATGMAAAMVNFLASLIGHVRGGLHYVLLGGMYLVSGISGSKAADMAAVAPVLFPEMRKRGTEPGRMVALLSAAGAQTETVPPSLVLIAVGSVTNVSIAALFTGGLLPAAMLGVILCMVVWWQAGSDGERLPSRVPTTTILRCLVTALPALILPFVIRSAVIEGVATATEVSTIGIAYTLIVGALFFRELNWKHIVPMLIDTATMSGAVLFVIGAASGMAWALTQSGFSTLLADAMAALPGGQPSFLIVSVATFVVLGAVLEGIPAIVLFGPLLFPVATSMGIHEVHYAVVVILAMGIGLFAPPFGVGYYMACAIGNVSPDVGMKPSAPYLIVLFLAVLILAFLPWISVGFL
jgi:tripartite ATP-independent transporter DctM subunit